ncbi:3'(2'),5'-bisphosphate nucleotidase CysQ [Pseudooceanicola sp.]|uniref:3'(2'),5'-bisphosphate nucleotidase CysQ n=1 Tax=Pseudooceanicola sp. TaxID=1914328 RepID=UPI0026121ABD|nr:3'(2'),5'-bisphosphate nucleotidase CysQ [Pseudooceanicola sp.]MDF1855166.1 3'(2'),5'-bisphosphate nucleotidase CysQ [Pseudooceanicola sp.]
MLEADLDLLVAAAREAGEIALDFAGRAHQKWEKPDGAGPVTEADLAVNAMLEAKLREARPDYGWLSEESPDDPDRLTRERVFVIDPIDGTRSFIEGGETWAHALAVVENGTVTAAVVFLPVKDKLYSAAVDEGAWLNARPIRASHRTRVEGATMLAAKPAYESRHWPGGMPVLVRHYRPSLAYRLALVAEGRFDAMLTLRDSWEWDIAAGALLLAEAGAAVSDRHGGPLKFNNPHPQVHGVVAAGPDVHSGLLAGLHG